MRHPDPSATADGSLYTPRGEGEQQEGGGGEGSMGGEPQEGGGEGAEGAGQEEGSGECGRLEA